MPACFTATNTTGSKPTPRGKSSRLILFMFITVLVFAPFLVAHILDMQTAASKSDNGIEGNKMTPIEANANSGPQAPAKTQPATVNTPPAKTSTSKDTQTFNASLEPGCAHFLKRAAAPGTYFLTELQTPRHVKFNLPVPRIPPKIFFIHYNKELKDPRMLCSVESALRQNVNHSVTLYANNPKALNASGVEKWLNQLPINSSARLRVSKLDWNLGMKDTPLQEWFQNGTYKRSTWVDQNLGNAFRLGMLWKSGGVYLDMDIVNVNPLGAIGRAVGKQSQKISNNAFFSMEKGDVFIWEVMKEFVAKFNGYKWGHNGPAAVSRTIWQCKSPYCKSLSIEPPERFYPFNYAERHEEMRFQDQCDRMQSIADTSIGVHYWHNRMKGLGSLPRHSILHMIMNAHCPTLFHTFEDKELGVGPGGAL